MELHRLDSSQKYRRELWLDPEKTARLEGAVIIRGGWLEDGEFESTGNLCLDEFANAEGEIKIRGSVNTGATPTCLIVSASMA